MLVPMLFNHSQTEASPKLIGCWRKQLLGSFQIGAFLPIGSDNFLRRSSSTGKGSLSHGSNCSRKLLFVLRVFLANSILSASSSRAAGVDSTGFIIEDESDLTWELVFESPVRSGFWAPKALDRDRDRSFKSHIPKKTGPNRCEPVLVGLLRFQNRFEPV
jgi:hypothetical protein